MKKVLIVLLILLLSVSFVLPSFAANYEDIGAPTDISSISNLYAATYPYAAIFKDSYGAFVLYASIEPATAHLSSGVYYWKNSGFAVFTVWRGAWSLVNEWPAGSGSTSLPMASYNTEGYTLLCTNYTMLNDSGTAHFYPDYYFWLDPYGPPEAPDDGTGDTDDEYTGFLSGFFNDVAGWFGSLINSIKELPSRIVSALGDLLRDIFIPDPDYFEERIELFVDELQRKFSFDTSAFENLFLKTSTPGDIDMDYDVPGVGTIHATVFDSDLLVKGVDMMRGYIRGFLMLMIFLYHIRQLIGFFGYDSGVVAGRTDAVTSNIKSQRGE